MEKHKILSSFDSNRLQSPILHLSPSNQSINSRYSDSKFPVLNSRSKLNSHSSSLALLKKTPTQFSTLKSEYLDIYPEWLLERNDFKSELEKLKDEKDIAKICEKPASLRSVSENKQLLIWFKQCPFFRSMSDFSCGELCSKLCTEYFKKGDQIIKEGDVADRMFIIFKGSVGIYRSGIQGCINVVGPCNTVGETALQSHLPRTATVIAKENLIVLRLMKEDYFTIDMRPRHKQRTTISNLLKSIPFFQNLIGSRLEAVVWSMLIMRYQNNSILYSDGDSANSIYFVNEGTIEITAKVTLVNKSKIPTKNKLKESVVYEKTYQVLVKKIAKGDFFGEEEIMDECHRKNKATCKEECEIFVLTKENLMNLFGENERKQIFAVHKRMQTADELRKKLKKYLKSKHKKFNAILDATNTKRDVYTIETDKIKNKKVLKALKLINNHKNEINQSLIEEKCFIERL